jgi:hypothetical protein
MTVARHYSENSHMIGSFNQYLMLDVNKERLVQLCLLMNSYNGVTDERMEISHQSTAKVPAPCKGREMESKISTSTIQQVIT